MRSYRSKRLVALAAIAPALVIGLTAVAHATGGSAAASDPKNLAQHHRVVMQPTDSVPPPATDPALCGEWSAASSNWGRDTAARYGEVITCAKINDMWFVTTAGTPNGPGAVGTLRCRGDATCLDGTRDHSAMAWKWHPASRIGVIKLLEEGDHRVTLDVGDQEQAFDLDGDTFAEQS